MKYGKKNMSSTNIRYNCFPQMEDYDIMPTGIFSPYSMLSGPISYSSPRINTDALGFRNSYFNSSIVFTG
jgi:hypothetical protein